MSMLERMPTWRRLGIELLCGIWGHLWKRDEQRTWCERCSESVDLKPGIVTPAIEKSVSMPRTKPNLKRPDKARR
jgi:hypothetical protein